MIWITPDIDLDPIYFMCKIQKIPKKRVTLLLVLRTYTAFDGECGSYPKGKQQFQNETRLANHNVWLKLRHLILTSPNPKRG